MLKDLEELTTTEIENIKNVIQELFRCTCILQIKCDAVTLELRDNPRYHMCAKYREFIADYLEVLGCELVHDPSENLFRVAGGGVKVENMSLTTTRLVVLLKLIYHEKIMGEGLRATVTNLEEIRQYGVDTSLLNRKLTEQEWQEALVLMRTHQMITFPGAISNMEDDTPIYIYSTVNIYCNTATLGELVEYYKAKENGIGSGIDETFDFTQAREEEEDEQSQEDLY